MNWLILENNPTRTKYVLETIATWTKEDFTNNFSLHFSLILLHLDHNPIIFEQHLERHGGGIQSGSYKRK